MTNKIQAHGTNHIELTRNKSHDLGSTTEIYAVATLTYMPIYCPGSSGIHYCWYFRQSVNARNELAIDIACVISWWKIYFWL